MAAGLRFENYALERVENFPGFQSSTEEEDLKAGTDFYWYGVAIDVTLYQEKSSTEWVGSIELACSRVHIGIRTGNGRVHFSQPVLVLCFELLVPANSSGLRLAAEEIVVPLIEDAVGMLWDYEDAKEVTI